MKWIALSIIVIGYAGHWMMLAGEGISGFANGSLPLQVLGAGIGSAVILVPIVALLSAGD